MAFLHMPHWEVMHPLIVHLPIVLLLLSHVHVCGTSIPCRLCRRYCVSG